MVYKEKFKDLENFETDAYLRNLAKLNRELRELEQRSAKGQLELESRIEGVNKRYNLVLPASYMDAINKKVSGINFLAAKQNIDEKLGGEFDYNDFQTDIDQVMLDFKADKDMYYLNLKETDVYVPERPSKADREYFEKIQGEPSILDVLKQKIKDLREKVEPKQQGVEGLAQENIGGGNKGRIVPQPKPLHPALSQGGPLQKPPTSNQKPSGGAITVLARPAKSSNLYSKPEHLRRIQSQPMPCPVDVRFRKLNPDPNDYMTFFENPDPMDVAQIEKRRNQPYAEQLRQEYDATKNLEEDPYNYNQGTRRAGPPQYNTGRLPPTSDEPTTRPPGGMRKQAEPQMVEPGNQYSGLNTQELVDRPIRKPSSASESKRGDPEYPEFDQQVSHHKTVHFDDMLGKQPRDTITVDEGGRHLIDEDVLKERIKTNMGSIKDFFRKDASYKPFEGMNYSDEYPAVNKAQQQNIDSMRSNAVQINQSQVPYQKNEEMVKQITDNFANLLNDIMAGVRANQAATPHQVIPPSNIAGGRLQSFHSPRVPESGDIRGEGQGIPHESQRDRQQPAALNLQSYYDTLNNFYSSRQSLHETGQNYGLTKPQQSIRRRQADLDEYLNHLDSGRQSEQNRPHMHGNSQSDGEVGTGSEISHPKGPEMQQVTEEEDYGQKSEGELSDIGNKIFFD